MAKQLVRDQDGSATAGARQPGTLAPLITSNDDHYHVTKNPVADPVIQPEAWSLALDGEVVNPVRLDYGTLRQLPTVELAKTLECVSNLTDKCELVPFGCELIGTASWKGVRLSDILDLAGGLKPGVVAVAMIGEDEFVSSIPAEAALDPATIVAYEMNGAVLPYEHGYPARVLVPGRYGYKSPKWIRVIRPSTRPVLDWYGQRNWNTDGIVRTMTRIDVPAPGATVPAGRQRVAGIAYASNRGISQVEYSADGGASWSVASILEPRPGPDAWVRWEGAFDVPAGATVALVSRATDGLGVLQQEAFSLAQPDGGAGWNHISVTGA
jgi:DMSO/TMAO reductase YedYZ molybdopterin-dependent catalytic subunit